MITVAKNEKVCAKCRAVIRAGEKYSLKPDGPATSNGPANAVQLCLFCDAAKKRKES